MRNSTKANGRTNRATLNQQIEGIFEQASGKFPKLETIQEHLENFARAAKRGQVHQAAEGVIALLRLDLDDLRRAALLSVMVRLAGERKFHPIAGYVLEKRTAYVTSQG